MDRSAAGTRQRRCQPSRGDDEERGTQLLADIRTVFASKGAPILDQGGRPVGTGLHTATLLAELIDMKERPWATYRDKGDKPINDRGLAAALKHFDIKPGPLSVAGVQQRGYRLEDFTDAFSRYLSARTPLSNCQPVRRSGFVGVQAFLIRQKCFGSDT